MKKEDSQKWAIGLSALLILLFVFMRSIRIYDGAPPFTAINLLYSLLMMAGFYWLDRAFKFEFNAWHYAFIAVIGASSFVLGPTYFFIYTNYDKVLHFFQPIMFSSIIFHMMRKLKISLGWKLVFTFFIISSLLGIFEIAEFGLDRFFDWKLQGVFLQNLQGSTKLSILLDPLTDTHWDMIAGNIGALAYSLSIYLWNKKKKH